MKLLNKHNNKAHSKRVDAIFKHLSKLIKPKTKVLDVGCGDGLIASKLADKKDCLITAIDTLVPKKTYIHVQQYDGCKLPFKANSFDYVLLIDVLHHSRDPLAMLKEAARVSKTVIIKDHTYWNPLGHAILLLADYISNKPKGVDLPMNFISRSKWNDIIGKAGLSLLHFDCDWNWKQKKEFDPVRHIFISVKKRVWESD